MRRRITASHPLILAALAGAALGLLAAVLLLRFGDPPGAGTFTRSNRIFLTVSLPTGRWMNMVFGWTWWENRAAEFMTTLSLNGAVWAVALTALIRRLRGSARARWVAAGSIVAGATLAMLVRIAGIPDIGPNDGVGGLVFLAQVPGIMLLTLSGYDTMMYDGTVAGGLFRPGPTTLTLFALANALLAAGFIRVARFTWRWIRTPMPRRGPVAHG